MVLRYVDNFLNSITMYRLLLYGLLLLAGVGILFGFIEVLPYSGLGMLASAGIIYVVGVLTNKLFVKLTGAVANVESVYITGLILFLILLPPTRPMEYVFVAAAAFLAMASKFVFAIRKKHLFNPAAIALVLITFAGSYSSVWWVSSKPLMPLVVIIGLLVVRKIRRFTMFLTYFVVCFVTIMSYGVWKGVDLVQLAGQIVTSWPIIFCGTIMLTEPLTMPPTQRSRMLFGAIVGFILSIQIDLGPIHPTPELGLVIGNLYAFTLGNGRKYLLRFEGRREIADEIYEFDFAPNSKPVFVSGQYMEWTLPHDHNDSRGVRRYFTIASSPTEPLVKLGVKIGKDRSSFKDELLKLKEGALISGDQLVGDFVLKDGVEKFVFIAGGIGITPFRSMAKYLTDMNIKKDIVLFYACSTADEFAYQDVFAAAEKIGMKTVYVVTKKENAPPGWSGAVGYLTPEMVKEYVTDYQHRMYYLSGPNRMVDSYKHMLWDLGIPHSQTKTDYFPGF